MQIYSLRGGRRDYIMIESSMGNDVNDGESYIPLWSGKISFSFIHPCIMPFRIALQLILELSPVLCNIPKL